MGGVVLVSLWLVFMPDARSLIIEPLNQTVAVSPDTSPRAT